MTTAPAPAAPPAVEWELATDMLRRGLPVAPALVLVAALGWRVEGALSAAYGVALVLANLAVSAALLAWGARRSLGVLAGVALGGFVVRLGLVALAIAAVRDQAWVAMVPLGLTILVTQLGLLWWETRHLSLSLAYPGVKPPRGGG
ncbi:MAG: ATP synthase subunit I [Actinomycetota bacterium]|nr:ATP synthase subunit I [Actinomycetota bacterium]